MRDSVIGSYKLVEKLGEGGMGVVYLAEHMLLGRKAAVKVLLPQLSARQGIVDRFFNEARAATAIADAGIVQIFDFGYDGDGSAYIVMEFLDGEALDVRLRRLGRIPVLDALRICRQVAASLAAAHAKSIVHRDLKPENIFLVADHEVAGGERAKILDFGIAKLADDPGKVKTHAGALMGTPVYMSPEQCRGAGQVDHRSDIYALGCVLFHLLTGRPPFDGDGVGTIIAAHLREPPPAPSSLLAEIPPQVDAVVLSCLAKDPAERYPNMGELAGAIDGVMQYIAPGALAGPYMTPAMAGATPPPSYGSRPPTDGTLVLAQGTRPPVAGSSAGATAPTTLSASAGSTPSTGTAAPRGSNRWLVIAAVALLGAAAGTTFALTRTEQQSAAPSPPAPAVVVDAAVPRAVAPPDAAVPAAVLPPDAGIPDAAPAPAKPRTKRDRRRPRDRRPAPERKQTPPPGVPGDLDGDGIPDVR